MWIKRGRYRLNVCGTCGRELNTHGELCRRCRYKKEHPAGSEYRIIHKRWGR